MKYLYFILSTSLFYSCSKKTECNCVTQTTENGIITKSYTYKTKHNDNEPCRTRGNADSVNGVWLVNTNSCTRIN